MLRQEGDRQREGESGTATGTRNSGQRGPLGKCKGKGKKKQKIGTEDRQTNRQTERREKKETKQTSKQRSKDKRSYIVYS